MFSMKFYIILIFVKKATAAIGVWHFILLPRIHIFSKGRIYIYFYFFVFLTLLTLAGFLLVPKYHGACCQWHRNYLWDRVSIHSATEPWPPVV
jgi:hypothetical protein